MSILNKIIGMFTLNSCDTKQITPNDIDYYVIINGEKHAVMSRYQDILRFAVTYDKTHEIVFCVEDVDNKRSPHATKYYEGFRLIAGHKDLIETKQISSRYAAKKFRDILVEKVNL